MSNQITIRRPKSAATNVQSLLGNLPLFSELERDPAFSRKMLSGLSRRLHGLVKDVEAYSLRSSAERVIGYLLRDDETPAEVQLSAGKSVVASRLNMTPEHFSRVLHELSAAGLIEVDGRTVRILDLEGLRGYRV